MASSSSYSAVPFVVESAAFAITTSSTTKTSSFFLLSIKKMTTTTSITTSQQRQRQHHGSSSSSSLFLLKGPSAPQEQQKRRTRQQQREQQRQWARSLLENNNNKRKKTTSYSSWWVRRLEASSQQQDLDSSSSSSYVPPPPLSMSSSSPSSSSSTTISSTSEMQSSSLYVRQKEENNNNNIKNKKKFLYPEIGDIVLYYDLDGGKMDGEVLVGKITFIQKQQGTPDNYIFELVQLEDVNDGYYAEYSQRQRNSKKTIRNYMDVRPLSASYVSRENAFYIPTNKTTGIPIPRAMTYDDISTGYNGPISIVDDNIVAEDGLLYDALKSKIYKYAAISGLLGTIIIDYIQGTNDAIIYGGGVFCSLLYLFFLSLKTDTIASSQSRMGSRISGLRFITPILLLGIIAAYNISLGPMNPVLLGSESTTPTVGLFNLVTTEQFASAMFGFLTYRLPLFVIQIQEGLATTTGSATSSDNDDLMSMLPGSAGIALSSLSKQQLQKQQQQTTTTTTDGGVGVGGLLFDDRDLITVFLISGPQYTGRSELVQRFIQEQEEEAIETADGNNNNKKGRFVVPKYMDKIQDPAQFERLEERDEFITIDSTGRYGLTKDGIFKAVETETAVNNNNDDNDADRSMSAAATGITAKATKPVVIIDANVDVAQKLSQISGIRIIGVWIGLNSMAEFDERITKEIKSGKVTTIVPSTTSSSSKDEENATDSSSSSSSDIFESHKRAKLKQVVKDIEYGLTSGIFEFTILNNDDNRDNSLKELRAASAYCFLE